MLMVYAGKKIAKEKQWLGTVGACLASGHTGRFCPITGSVLSLLQTVLMRALRPSIPIFLTHSSKGQGFKNGYCLPLQFSPNGGISLSPFFPIGKTQLIPASLQKTFLPTIP